MTTIARNRTNWFPSSYSFIDRFFDDEVHKTSSANASGSLPSVNIRENVDEFIVQLAAPGYKKEDFSVNFEDDYLTIASEKEPEAKQDGVKVTRREFEYHSFKRTFSVSREHVDSDGIHASYEAGILTVVLPKREELKPKPPKTIQIQ